MHDEDHTDRDGVFSYSAEVHAFIVGVAVGMVAIVPIPTAREFVTRAVGLGKSRPSKAMDEVQAEPWYALAGFVLGMVGAGLVVSIALWVLLAALIDVVAETVQTP